ncbi:hypothetical protein SCP_0702350 [Sparassis crispa]|uniref:Uncharacterized protein n=1 Tax=Sparassis crispa TaxID=139825 RepID=A0A401GSA3_9APHY|nr:hypothetical protein SCP_0702350 [Sparassis crispa]GBE85049.1 hypothetical protein SCP_0702350 [Sparassis crispa]
MNEPSRARREGHRDRWTCGVDGVCERKGPLRVVKVCTLARTFVGRPRGHEKIYISSTLLHAHPSRERRHVDCVLSPSLFGRTIDSASRDAPVNEKTAAFRRVAKCGGGMRVQALRYLPQRRANPPRSQDTRRREDHERDILDITRAPSRNSRRRRKIYADLLIPSVRALRRITERATQCRPLNRQNGDGDYSPDLYYQQHPASHPAARQSLPARRRLTHDAECCEVHVGSTTPTHRKQNVSTAPRQRTRRGTSPVRL